MIVKLLEITSKELIDKIPYRGTISVDELSRETGFTDLKLLNRILTNLAKDGVVKKFPHETYSRMENDQTDSMKFDRQVELENIRNEAISKVKKLIFDVTKDTGDTKEIGLTLGRNEHFITDILSSAYESLDVGMIAKILSLCGYELHITASKK